jgi:UDP-glucose 4-epimerase
MTKKILVTGGAGYIGSHTVVELVKAGYTPIIVDNFSNSVKSVLGKLEKITRQAPVFYQQDFQDQSKLRQVIKDHKIDGVIHFAAFKAVGESVKQPLKYYQNNVAGFVSLLEVLKELAIPNLVFSSSCTVYGQPDKLPVIESTPFKPAESPYGATKQMCESILKDVTSISSSFKSIALRYFNPIGAHPSGLIGELPLGTPANLIPLLTQAVAGLRPSLTIYGDDYPTADGTCVRDYIHVVDLARAHVQALSFLDSQSPASFSALNIGTGAGSSVLEVIKTFESVTGHNVPYEVGPRRQGDIVSTYAAVERAQRLLGWKAKLTLGDALKDAWRWQKNLAKTVK